MKKELFIGQILINEVNNAFVGKIVNRAIFKSEILKANRSAGGPGPPTVMVSMGI